MPDAPNPAGLPPQTHQGVGARILRRFGGALQSVIAAGIGLAGRRRSLTPRPSRPAPSGTENLTKRAAPRRKPATHQPRAQAPVGTPTPARSRWLARWFGRKQPRSARRRLSDSADAPFTPQAYPGLSPEACAFFNTPLEECDPATLRLVLAVFAAQIADSLPPESGVDAEALFSRLCDRLGAKPDAADPEVLTVPPDDAAPNAPSDEPAPAEAATLAPTFAQDTAPHAVIPAALTFRPSDVSAAAGSAFPRRHHDHRRGTHHRLAARPQALPPRRLCYAACAGPP